MGKKNATYFAVCAGLTIFALSYCAVEYFQIALPRYYPTIHVWTTEKKEGIPGMAWYAMICFSSILSLLAGLAVYYALPAIFKKNPSGHLAHRIAGAVAAASSILMMLFFLWVEISKWMIGK